MDVSAQNLELSPGADLTNSMLLEEDAYPLWPQFPNSEVGISRTLETLIVSSPKWDSR